MKSIELRLLGGLGNQLYQYAAARYIQKKYNCPRLIIDTGEYDTFKLRELELDKMVHNETVMFYNQRSIVTTFMREAFHVYQRLYRDMYNKHAPQHMFHIGKHTYMCSSVEYCFPEYLNCEYLHMYGYFVSAATALEMREELMGEIELLGCNHTEAYSIEKGFCENMHVIGVSIRCGDDYVRNGWPVCSREYYISGIRMVLSKKQYTDAVIMVFADEIDYIIDEKWFAQFEKVIYVKDISVCESFDLLRRCSDYVCSNSSFSWWGAFLTYSDHPIIINPNRIFSPNYHEDDKKTFYSGLTFIDYQSGEQIGEDFYEICSGYDPV